MKKRTFLMMTASLLIAAMGAISCSKNGGGDGDGPGEEPGGDAILYASPTTLNFGWDKPAAQTIKVTTDAADGWKAGTTASWYKAEKEGNNLVVTAETNDTGSKRSHQLKISATGATDVTISINQSAQGEVHASLQGSAYYVWAIDAISYELIKDNILVDFGPDNVYKTVHIWDTGNTLVGQTPTGLNFYETTSGGWMAFKVAQGTTWSGGAYDWNYDALDSRKIDWSAIEADGGVGWYLHAAIRGTKGLGHRLRLLCRNEAPNTETTSYSIRFDDYNVTESDWTEVEVSMEEIVNAGWGGSKQGYTMSFHGSGQAGSALEWDALFIYKK